MRLLNTSTLEIREFLKVPPYAIVSHTWAEEEVTFPEMEGDREDAQSKLGYSKIEACCRQAAKDGLEYVWIDTCCIDKRNSTELAEALNAMFRWYQRAKICYVYLADVESTDDHTAADGQFANCRWFTRGWTLQELIGSSCITFLAKDWIEIGTKESFKSQLVTITGIFKQVLMDGKNVQSASVAQRMSWAARRETTRIEDRAYCLMGLFGVHMTMIYGEEEKAFERLQLAIIKTLPDESIFAWEGDGDERGLLARSPIEFANSGNVRTGRPDNTGEQSQPFTMTQLGLQITIPVTKKAYPSYSGLQTYRAYLNCSLKRTDAQRAANAQPRRVMIHLHFKAKNQVVRVNCGKILSVPGLPGSVALHKETLYVKQVYSMYKAKRNEIEAFKAAKGKNTLDPNGVAMALYHAGLVVCSIPSLFLPPLPAETEEDFHRRIASIEPESLDGESKIYNIGHYSRLDSS